ncbi:hypothetical protein [Archangium sp.]|uniref:hypothetical protein n=1 Tax=Archangium sp. TaxID=1872627 RepID=UPI002D747DAA|nr:hypothetical protein [Archangium sp.]HYO54331.1 hypothetical protein [Archangium sp.]
MTVDVIRRPSTSTTLRPALLLAGFLLAAMMAGCPHAFGRGGTIDRAVLKDIHENMRHCSLSLEEFEKYCLIEDDERCPPSCQS